MISYKPLQKLLIDKDLKKSDLKEKYGISWGTLSKMNSNKYVSLEVIDKLCEVLKCQPGDLIEYVPEKKEKE